MWSLLRATIIDWYEDRAQRLGAALATTRFSRREFGHPPRRVDVSDHDLREGRLPRHRAVLLEKCSDREAAKEIDHRSIDLAWALLLGPMTAAREYQRLAQ
jgi:hypothetical protein